jgi:hypothetical protein
LSGLDLFRIRAVLIVGLAVEYVKDQQHYEADQGNQANQDLPAGASGVMQPSHLHADVREQHGQAVDRHERIHVVSIGVHLQHASDDPQHDEDDEVDQLEHPVFLAARTALEHGVFLQDFKIPVQWFSTFLHFPDAFALNSGPSV